MPVNNECKIIIVSSKSQTNILSTWLSGSGDNCGCWVLFRPRLVLDLDAKE